MKLGVAEKFFGELYGNEEYITDQGLAVRGNDGVLRASRYKEKYPGVLEPEYTVELFPQDEHLYMQELSYPQELVEPSILIIYGERFLQLIEPFEEFNEFREELLAQGHFSDKYPQFYGFIGSYEEYLSLNRYFAKISRNKLYEFFDSEESDFEPYKGYFRIWQHTEKGRLDVGEFIALDTAGRFFIEPKDEEHNLKLMEIFAKHASDSDFEEIRERYAELIG